MNSEMYEREVKVSDWELARALPDMHVHTSFCPHATRTIEEIAKLNRQGFTSVINEHAPITPELYDAIWERWKQEGINRKFFEKVVSRTYPDEDGFRNLVESATELEIPLGLEVDIVSGFEKYQQGYFDKVIRDVEGEGGRLNHLSVALHLFDGMQLFYPETYVSLDNKYSLVDVAEKVYTVQADFLGKYQDKVDFLCHPFLPYQLMLKHTGVDNKGKPKMHASDVMNATYKGMRELIDTAVETDTALEVNMSGIDRCSRIGLTPEHNHLLLNIPNPHFPDVMLRYAISHNAKLVLGSDAHHFGEQHRYFDQMYNHLAGFGCKEVYKFDNGVMVPISLDL